MALSRRDFLFRMGALGAVAAINPTFLLRAETSDWSPSVRDVVPPEEVADKFAPYFWGKSPSLEACVEDAKALGSSAIRLYAGPYFTYQGQDIDPYTPLSLRILDPSYKTVLNAGFKKIMLTCYDSASYWNRYKLASLSSAVRPQVARPGVRFAHLNQIHSDSFHTMAADRKILDEVKEEFRQLSFYLSKFDTDFYLSNWEAGNDAVDPKLWPAYAQYMQARVDGIVAGREEAKALHYPGRVWAGFEFIFVPGYTPVGSSKPVSDLVEIGGKLQGLDFFSYSSWRSITYTDDPVKLVNDYAWGFKLVREFVRDTNQDPSNPTMPSRYVIGEFGNNAAIHPDLSRMEMLFRIAVGEGAELVVPWNGYDQVGDIDAYGRDDSRYGAYTLARSLTPQGAEYQKWYSQGLVPR